jgi:hypothetical protein
MYYLILVVWTQQYQDEPEWTHIVRESPTLTSDGEQEVINRFYRDQGNEDFDYDDEISNVWSQSITKVENYEVRLYKEF